MKKGIWFIVIVAIGVSGFFAIRNGREQNLLAEKENLETVLIERGSLTATIGATGVVRANQTANINWQTSGTVDNVMVNVGSTVVENESLATLLQSSLSQSLILAQADLVNAENALNDLYSGFDTLALANSLQAIADAEVQLRTSQNRWNSVNFPANQSYIDDAEATLVFAQEDLNRAQDAYDNLGNGGSNLVRANRQASLAQAQISFNNAAARYNALIGVASAVDLSDADAEVALSQARLDTAKSNYETLIAGPTANDILAAEARVAAVNATLNLTSLSAPFGGVITKSEITHGDLVNSSTLAFRIDDLSKLIVDLDVSEVDINRVFVGQSVSLFFDAILGEDYEGIVIAVSPVGEIASGIVNFKVSIEVTNPDELVKPGMTAAVNIVVSEIENVLIVPNRAVRVVDGERVVYMMVDNEIEMVAIELGANSDFYSEVIGSSLEAGDEIILNPTADINGSGGPGGRPGMFGGGN